MAPQNPIVIQEGSGARRALVYLLHVGDGEPNSRYPRGTFAAIHEACGPEPMIVVRGDDGTAGKMPIVDALAGPIKLCQLVDEFEISRVVVGGWSAGVRGIRRFLGDARIRRVELNPAGEATRLLAGIVAADGLHAPWSERGSVVSQTVEEADAGCGAPFGLSLGPSEVFREYVERARRGEFAFVLTHCMQDYMEAARATERYMSTSTVARALTGFDCVPADGEVVRSGALRLLVLSYGGPRVDRAGHVRQQREALPAGLAQMRTWGLFQP